MPANQISWKNESVLMGVPAGADQIRQYHPTIMMFDEAAHLGEFEAALAAAATLWPESQHGWRYLHDSRKQTAVSTREKLIRARLGGGS